MRPSLDEEMLRVLYPPNAVPLIRYNFGSVAPVPWRSPADAQLH